MIQVIKEDLEFMSKDIIDGNLLKKNTPKDTYTKYIKSLIRKATLKELIEKKKIIVKKTINNMESNHRFKKNYCEGRHFLYALNECK